MSGKTKTNTRKTYLVDNSLNFRGHQWLKTINVGYLTCESEDSGGEKKKIGSLQAKKLHCPAVVAMWGRGIIP
jgi:hypothetical protein